MNRSFKKRKGKFLESTIPVLSKGMQKNIKKEIQTKNKEYKD